MCSVARLQTLPILLNRSSPTDQARNLVQRQLLQQLTGRCICSCPGICHGKHVLGRPFSPCPNVQPPSSWLAAAWTHTGAAASTCRSRALERREVNRSTRCIHDFLQPGGIQKNQGMIQLLASCLTKFLQHRDPEIAVSAISYSRLRSLMRPRALQTDVISGMALSSGLRGHVNCNAKWLCYSKD